MPTTQDGALESDHINYLVFRYLQEAGHENAAKALYQDWHRSDRHGDPESFPFASRVGQFELVKIIQDGLFLDRVQAQVTNQAPRFDFIARPNQTLNRTQSQVQHQNQLQVNSRNQSPNQNRNRNPERNQQQEHDVQDQLSHHHHRTRHSPSAPSVHNDFPMPAPKRLKKTTSGANDPKRVNNLSYDDSNIVVADSRPAALAAAAATAAAAAEAEAEAEARAASSSSAPPPPHALVTATTTADDDDEDAGDDPDASDDRVSPSDTDRAMSDAVHDRANSASLSSPPPTRPAVETYSSGTQTESASKMTRTQTAYWSVDNYDSNILHAVWNPSPESSARLLAIGESLCRFYHLPRVVDHAAQSAHYDVQDMLPGSIATAACWHPSGRYATCSVESRRSIDDTEESFRYMFDVEGTEDRPAKRPYSDNAYIRLLQAMGPTVTSVLRYNSLGTRLLSVSMNVKRGLLEVWEGLAEEPIAVKVFPAPIMDAVWAAEDVIIVCGTNCLESYRVHIPADVAMANGDTNGDTDTFTSTGARNLTLLHSCPTMTTWERVRFDPQTNATAAISAADEEFVVLAQPSVDSWNPLRGFVRDHVAAKGISALAFENVQAGSASVKATRLATAHRTGGVNVYSITGDSCTRLHTLSLNSVGSMVQEAALALCWSPDGKYLAAASEEGVKVWDPSLPFTPSLNWRAGTEHWDQDGDGRDGGRDVDRDSGMGDSDSDVQTINEPSLSWDSLGRSLCFAMGRKMAVIELLS